MPSIDLLRDLNRRLDAEGVKQLELAKKLDMAQAQLSRYLTGKVAMPLRVYEQIMVAIGAVPGVDPLEEFRKDALSALLRATPEQWAILRHSLLEVFPHLSTVNKSKNAG